MLVQFFCWSIQNNKKVRTFPDVITNPGNEVEMLSVFVNEEFILRLVLLHFFVSFHEEGKVRKSKY